MGASYGNGSVVSAYKRINMPKKKIKTPVLIAFDQSKKETGFTVVRYHPVGGPQELILKGTIKKTTPESVWKEMDKIKLTVAWKGMPYAMARERGYYDPKSPDAIGALETVGGWIEMAFRQHFGKKPMYRYFPNVWRVQTWGHSGMSGLKHFGKEEREKHLKNISLGWARAVFKEIEDHHQADSLGILCCLGVKLTKAGVIVT